MSESKIGARTPNIHSCTKIANIQILTKTNYTELLDHLVVLLAGNILAAIQSPTFHHRVAMIDRVTKTKA